MAATAAGGSADAAKMGGRPSKPERGNGLARTPPVS